MTSASAPAPDGVGTVMVRDIPSADDTVARFASRMLGYLSLVGACAGIALVLL